MTVHIDGAAPYAPAAAVLTVIARFRGRGLTTPIDRGVVERAGVSASVAPRTLQALKLLELVDQEGLPTRALVGLGKASSDAFPERLAAVLRRAYEEVFRAVEPRDDPPYKVRDAFRAYKPRGQQERMVSLFLGLCEAAGIVDEARRKRQARAAPAAGAAATPQTGQHPFIRGLVQTLPEVGSAWPVAERRKWANAALAAFDLIYE